MISAREANSGRIDLLVILLVCVLSSFSAVLLTEDYCSGETDSTLSKGSVLRFYPCEGTVLARATFLARNSPCYFKELLLFSGPNVWFALTLWAWLLRVASALLLPNYLYVKVAAPLFTYTTRATPLAFCLAAGPRKPLTATAAHFLFRVQAVGDAFLSLTQPVVHVGIEAAFTVLNIAAASLLVIWHGSRYPGINVSLANQLVWRLTVSVVAHLLSKYLRRPPPAKASPAAAASLLGSKGADPLPPGGHLQPAPDGADGCNHHLPALPSHVLEEVAPAPGARQYVRFADLANITDALATTEAKELPAGDGSTVAAGAPGPTHGRLPPYRSPVRRMTARIKIPLAEPGQLGAGYEDRLRELSERRGLVLAGVYVRSGCIELLVDEQLWPVALRPAGGGPQALPEQLLPAGAAVAGATAGMGAPGDGDAAALASWDLDALVRALELPPAPHGATAPHTAGAAGRGLSFQSTAWALATPHAAAREVEAEAEQPRRRVLSIQPRALLLAPGAAAARVSALVSCSAPGAGQREGEDDLEVLVRSPRRGAYLRAAASPRAAAAAAATAAGEGVVYDLEIDVSDLNLLGAPGEADVLLVEFRWGGRLSRATPLLLLPAGGSNAALSAELDSLAAALPSARREELNDLVHDLGQLLAAPAAAAAAPPPPPHRAELAEHLLGYARAAGLAVVAERVRAVLGAAPEPPSGPAAVPVPGGDCGGGSDGGVVPTAAAGAGGAAAGWRRAARDGRARGRSVVVSSLALAAGWRRAPEAEEAAYQAYAAPIVLAQAHAIQAVEVVSLLALLFRARHNLLHPSNLTTLAGCAVGTATALAWPLLPRRRWEAFVDWAKIPRYVAYLTAKVMIAWLGFPAPPGIVPYQLGPAMLVMEGVLLPGSCLLPLRTTALITLLKWPLGVGMALSSGASPTRLHAALLCGRVVVAALATTVACHTYLRLSYARRAAAAAAARGPAHQSGKGVKAD